MNSAFLSSEWKKWSRDSMMRFMLIYPLLFAVVGRYLLPWFSSTSGIDLAPFADVILVVLTLITPHVYGAIVGFSILDDRDDNILVSIQVSPLSVQQFLSTRLAMALVLSFFACLFVPWFADIAAFPLRHRLAAALLTSLSAPLTGLLINALSKNKIEGFVAMKGVAGILMIVPILALFFIDGRELFLAFAPGFWPAKVISSLIRGEENLFLTRQLYYAFGFGYTLALNALLLGWSLKRITAEGG